MFLAAKYLMISIWSISYLFCVGCVIRDIFHLKATKEYTSRHAGGWILHSLPEKSISGVLGFLVILLFIFPLIAPLRVLALVAVEPSFRHSFNMQFSKEYRDEIDYTEVLQLIEWKQKPDKYWEIKELEWDLELPVTPNNK